MKSIDVSKEITSNIKNRFIVSNTQELKKRLNDLNVDLKLVKDINTGGSVSDWEKVMGVFKKDKEVFAYSNTLNSEMNANIKIFS